MNIRIPLVVVSLVASVLIGLALARGGLGAAGPRDDGVTIGLSLDTLKEARWQADRDMFVRRAGELGARVLVLAANSDDTVQISDVEKLITNRVDVLVVVPHDGTAMAKAVAMAHEAGIPVIAYDRIIRDSDLDLYVSFDNVRVGELQAALTASCEVTNTGTRPGEEVVQLYVRLIGTSVSQPVRALRGFRRVLLAPGETKTVTFPLAPEDLALWNDRNEWVVEPAKLAVWIGPDSTGGAPALAMIEPYPA